MESAPLRVTAVLGYGERKNDLVYCKSGVPADGIVVFFPGDVQDFTENMQAHRDNKNYVKWNLEDTAISLRRKFPTCDIVVVKPSIMEYKTFSVFQNFVQSSKCGVPEHTPSNNAVEHLEGLLVNLSRKLQEKNEVDVSEAVTSSATSYLENLGVRLIGFSKGCVVLNQLLYEFHNSRQDKWPSANSLISSITDMYWLDGGHSGGKNTWITSEEVLGTAVELGIRIHIHVTPYQIRDERRPWIRKEERQFHETLRKAGATVDRAVHFEDSEPSLAVHFDVLDAFPV